MLTKEENRQKYKNWYYKDNNSNKVAEHRIRLKRKAVDYLGGVCVKCGYNKSMHSLTFHHLDPAKKTTGIASGSTRSWEIIKAELDKCIILCRNCHGEFHGNEWKIDNIMIENSNKAKSIYVERPLEHYRSDQENRIIPKVILNKCKICGKESKNAVYCSNKCSNKGSLKIVWPTNLEELVRGSSRLQVARSLGVSDVAVAKRLKRIAVLNSFQSWSKTKV